MIYNKKYNIAGGEVYTWGEGTYGQLGHGPAVPSYSKPLKVGQPLHGNLVVQIGCGSNHTAALTEKGKHTSRPLSYSRSLSTNTLGQLYTWGYGVNGRLGHGNEEDQKLPRLVTTMQGKKVIYHFWSLPKNELTPLSLFRLEKLHVEVPIRRPP
mgnify:CR=1 FL=1